MILRDESMTLEFDEETLSFPSQKCGHLFYSAKGLQNHDVTSHGNGKRFFCRNCNKKFRKDRHKLLHEGQCLGQYYLIFFDINYHIRLKIVDVKPITFTHLKIMLLFKNHSMFV